MERFSKWRIYALVIVVFLLGSGVLARLFSLQILQYDYYSALAQGQHQLYQTLFPQRGEIFMQDLSAKQRNQENYYSPLAINKEFQQVYLVPKDIPDQEKETLAEQLAQILDLDKEVILQRINKPDDPYEPLKHKVSQEKAEEIKNLRVKGLELAAETWRYYPNQSLAAHLIGFVGMTGEKKIGQYGLEGYYENELKGQPGFLTGEKDTAGYWIPSLNQRVEPARDGADLVLTIDQNIQFKAERELSQIVEQWQAEGGTIIIMEPATGAIRAMANWPSFDPNHYSQVEDINIFLNPASQKVYEPGSVFKPITMAAGLDSNKITPETVYQDKGQIRIKGSVIRNVDGKVYNQQTMTQVLEKSLNTGAVFVQQLVGEEIFQDYVQRFNFHQPTGIDLASEASGDIYNLFTGREINLATISFGQGITVTPLGLITALGAIANEGKLMRPFVVEKIIQPDGQEIVTQPQVVSQVIFPQTAEQLTKMLVSVVDNGYGRPAQVKGYSIAGKTGTAQIPDLEKGGYSDETIHTFVGFAPAFDPQFIILIKLDKPQGIRFASDSVGPVFKRLAKYLFNYLEIPPQ
jgi:cell division protein FtsI/penicillin-binding protein 2